MKVTVKKCLDALAAIEEIGQKQEDGKPLVIIPADRTRTGYWLSRLEDKLAPINKSFNTERDKLVQKLGEPFTIEDGNKQKKVEGKFKLKIENEFKFTEQIGKLLEMPEEIEFNKLDFELLEGINWPAGFILAVSEFFNEPQKK